MKRKAKIEVYIPLRPRSIADYQFGDEVKDYESPDPVSLTVPDETMTIQQMVARAQRGQAVVAPSSDYTGDDHFPDLKTLDLAELEELARENQDLIKTMQEDQEKINAEQAQRAAEAQKKAEEDQRIHEERMKKLDALS